MRRRDVYFVLISLLWPAVFLGHSAAAAEWSGFHVGASLGAAVSEADARTSVRAQGGYFTGDDHVLINDAGQGAMSETNLSAGLQAGYSKQFGNLLVGLVASANSLSFDDTRSSTVGYNTSPGNTFTLTQTVEADWQATLRPRIGWAQDNWLGYVSAGVAVTQLKTDYSFTDTAFSAVSRSSETEIVPGWSLGFGAQYALNENWSLSSEYLYTAYSGSKHSSVVSETSGGAPATLEHSAELNSHTVMIGVVYRFNP